jgi:phosphate transport system substrate-binding protein
LQGAGDEGGRRKGIRLHRRHAIGDTQYAIRNTSCWLILLLAAACAVPAPTPPPTPALVRLLVTDLTEPLGWDLALAYAKAHPAVAVVPQLAPAGNLAAELIAGRAELALTADPDPALFASPVAYLPWAVVVHPGNPLSVVSPDAARALFAGQLTEWSQLGGGPGQVQVVARAAGSTASEAFLARLWGPAAAGAAVTPNARLAPTWDALRALVAENPNAIGYLIGPALDESVRALVLRAEGQPAPDLRLLLVAAAAGEPAGPARDFVAWAQGADGQAVVALRHAPLPP